MNSNTRGGNAVIVSVPIELNNEDGITLFAAVESNQLGCVSLEVMAQSPWNWTADRFQSSISVFLREGIVWLDESTDSNGITKYAYYFPSIWNEHKTGQSFK